MKKVTTSQRLKEIMKERGLKQVDILELAKPFCDKYGIKLNKNDLSQYVSGKVEPGQYKLSILGHALNVSEAWLMGYDVPKIPSINFDDSIDDSKQITVESSSKTLNKMKETLSDFADNLDKEQKIHDEKIHIIKYRTLDEYGKKAVDSVLEIEYERCTAVENYDEPTIITFNRFNINKASAGCGYDLSNSDDWQEIKVIDTPEARKADFAVEVDGHSMEPTINDGDIVYVVVDADVPEGEIGLFRQNGEGFIKEKGKDRLISHNPDYPDIYPEDGEIDCVGRVIGIAELP